MQALKVDEFFRLSSRWKMKLEFDKNLFYSTHSKLADFHGAAAQPGGNKLALGQISAIF